MKTLRSVADLVYQRSLESADQLIRVLHVDDEPDFLKTTKQILELQDKFQVETALSVKEAMQKLEKQSFDVIVSDYLMPEKNGMHFLKELRESGNNIPFVLFTGKGREEVAIEALNLGADYYFSKSGKTETVYGELAHGIHTVVKASKAEEKLKESERKYRLLTENITDTIFIQDMNLDVKYVSRSVEKLSGFTPEEALKLKPQDFMTPESFERGVADFKEAVALAMENSAAEIPLKQYEYRRKDGSTFWGELRTKMLRDSAGCLVGIHGTLRDITERKKAEESLDKMMKELVTINEKLDVVGKLTRHDIRNKLAVILNKVYLAKQQLAGNHDVLEHLGDIESVVDQVENIFSFARTYEMVGANELSCMNVKRSVDEAAMLFSGMNGTMFVNECDGLTVLADLLLRQLFYNLIDNSLKHGENVTQIRVYYEEGENQLKLIYEDNGAGIHEDEKEKIFMERHGKGSGYGLYLIRKMCDAYGWTIKETGKLGKGAQFTMIIPKMRKGYKTGSQSV